jgi:proteic killer suppression protein
MVITFEEIYLQELYERGKTSDKKHRFQPDIVLRYKKRIDTLIDASCVEALYPVKSLHYEELKGDKEGISSIRVNDKYRIEFVVSSKIEDETIITICNITELSNHYK